MAKTNDDIYDILSDLVTILKQQDTNNNDDIKKRRVVRSVGNERIFTSLSKDLKEFSETVKEFQKIQNKYDRQVTNNSNPKAQYERQMNSFIEQLGKLNDAMDDGTEKFNNSREYIEEYHQTLLEQNSIQSDITTKKFNLSVLEEKLYKEKLEQDRLEIDARKGTLESEIEVEKTKTKARKELLLEEIKIRKELNKQLASPKIQLHEGRQRMANDIKKSAEVRGEKWGLTKDGKEKSFLEITKAFSKALSAPRVALQTQSIGRLGVKGFAAAVNATASAGKAIQSGKMNVSGIADKATSVVSKMGPMGAAAGGIIQIFKMLFEMFSKVDKAASDYTRSVGGGVYAQIKMRETAADLAVEMTKFGKTAYVAEEILARMGEASAAMGRNLEGLSTADLRSLQDLKNFGIDDQTIAQFDTFGISVHNVSKQLADLYGESGKRGLNAKATIKAFTSNLKMAQNYTFARGQKALMDMAMKSAQLKFNLRDAEQFANKVSTLEGAMTAGAQLSVLGGNFAMQGNPLAMMYNGLYDVEGLQNQMLTMTKGMAAWDAKKGQLDISAFDRERLKAMSQATGIDYSELTSMAFNQARVDRVSRQLGSGFSKDEEEYIKNLASLDNKGNAYIQVGGKEYSMDDIRNNKDGVRDNLKQESAAKDTKEGADLGDIWSSTRSIQDKLDDLIKTIKNMIVKPLMGIATKFVDDEKLAAMKLGIDENDKSAMAKLKRENERLNKTHWFDRWNSDEEALTEYGKRHKLGIYAEQQNTVNRAGGGFVSGDGGPTDDAIPARLSNGEFVVNAEATTRHRPLLEHINKNNNVHNGSNLMKFSSVNGYADGGVVGGTSSSYAEKIDVSPIKIEFGTLELKIGDLSRVLDSNEVASKLLNNSTFVDNIIKEIGIRSNFGYRKSESDNKFLDTPYVRSF